MKTIRIVPMATLYLPFPNEYHTERQITDDLPGDALGEHMVEAMRLAMTHPNYASLHEERPIFYMVFVS